jgi:GAF domain-containing protein
MQDMTKEKRYEELLPQVAALVDPAQQTVSVLANVCAALHQAFDWFWTGFYVVGDDRKLHLGPFQGTPACYTIPYGRGVCGTAWQRGETVVVPDVEAFPGHIACSSLSRSEIVVPLRDAGGRVRAVLDIDSTELATFDDTDRQWLERIAATVAAAIY